MRSLSFEAHKAALDLLLRAHARRSMLYIFIGYSIPPSAHRVQITDDKNTSESIRSFGGLHPNRRNLDDLGLTVLGNGTQLY